MRTRIIEFLRRARCPLIVAIHMLIVAFSNLLAFAIRFDGAIPAKEWHLFLTCLPLLIVIRGLMFIPFGLYQGLWRYASIWDLRNILSATISSTLVFYIVVHWIGGLTAYPRSIFVIDTLLLTGLLGIMRLARRLHRERRGRARTSDKALLIYGAGDIGEMILRDIKANRKFYNYYPMGFIDDDPRKQGQRIHGIRILGTGEDLKRVVREDQVDVVLLAMPQIDPEKKRWIIEQLEEEPVQLLTVPNLRELITCQVGVQNIRPVAVEDLLMRAPVGLQLAPLEQMIKGQRIMVTGAGGSIGGELCRQIARLGPQSLIALDQYENGLYETWEGILSEGIQFSLIPVVADVTDEARIDAIFETHKPHLVYHAAAHKHVPLMELNPCEAIKNNVRGMRILAEAACRHRVERFVLISSDKAVNPVNIMGATKRLGECIVRYFNEVCGASTIYVAVRFGNVLGSNGSVVPRFMAQIKNGGPVTVTHPDMRRYFMLISEAVELVLHASTQTTGGAIYVLEMGEQIRILDLAKLLIRLAGYVPEHDIPIAFTGLRPGEKMLEELVAANEKLENSAIPHVWIIHSDHLSSREMFLDRIYALEESAMKNNVEEVIETLEQLLPEFKSSKMSSSR